MKSCIYFFLAVVLFSGSTFAQDLALVQDGKLMGFINKSGDFVIKPQFDKAESFSGAYAAAMKDEKWGYIDTSGKTVIDPQYLNATNFKDNRAIALHLRKTVLSTNALNKQVVNYGYHEVVINLNGDVVSYLVEESVHITLTPENLRKAPVITAKPISGNLFAVMNAQKKWSVVKVD